MCYISTLYIAGTLPVAFQREAEQINLRAIIMAAGNKQTNRQTDGNTDRRRHSVVILFTPTVSHFT